MCRSESGPDPGYSIALSASATTLLDLAEVVVAGPHFESELGVGETGAVLGPKGLGVSWVVGELRREGDEVFEHVVGHFRGCLQAGESECFVLVGVLRVGEREFEFSPSVRGCCVEQLGDGHPECIGQGIEEAELGLDLAVLELGKVRNRFTDRFAHLGQREVTGFPKVSDSVAEHTNIERVLHTVLSRRSGEQIRSFLPVEGYLHDFRIESQTVFSPRRMFCRADEQTKPKQRR